MFNNTTHPYCEVQEKFNYVLLVVFPIAQIFINGFVCLGAFNSRSKLRQNYVTINVISTLTANMIFGLFSMYGILNSVYSIERGQSITDPLLIDSNDTSHTTLKIWWAFRATMSDCLFLIMSGNIAGLAHSVRERLNYINTSGFGIKEDKTGFSSKMKAIIILSCAWLIPIVMGIASAFLWNCVEYCICFQGSYGDRLICQQDVQLDCSIVFEPLKKSFLLCGTIMWGVYGIISVSVLISSINRQLSQKKIRRGHFSSGHGDVVVSDVMTSNRSEFSLESSSGRMDQPTKKMAKRFHFASLHYTIKFLFWLTSTFILFTTPFMVLPIIETVTNIIIPPTTVVIGISFCLFYSFICPFILVYYIPLLREAVRKLYVRALCCNMTVTVIKNPTNHNIQKGA